MNIEQAVRSIVDREDGPAILEIVGNEVLNWPDWYYEMYGEVRPPLTGGSIKVGADVKAAVHEYIESYSKELGKNFDEDVVQAVLDRLLNYRVWAPEYVENAYWGQAQDSEDEYFASYGSAYGSGDSGVRGEF